MIPLARLSSSGRGSDGSRNARAAATTATAAAAGSRASDYPVRLEAQNQGEYNRFLPLIKWLLAFPHYIVLFFVLHRGGCRRDPDRVLRRRSSPGAGRAGCSTTSPAPSAGPTASTPTSTCSPTATRRSRSATSPTTRSRIEIEYPEQVDRWRPLVHWLLILPYAFVAALLLHGRRASSPSSASS